MKVPPFLLVAAMTRTAFCAQDCSLFVDYGEGSDTNTGTAVDQPFKTLQHAVCWGSDEMGDRTICMRSGVHRLSETVNIDSRFAHAGRGLIVTTYEPDMAAGRGRAVLSGWILVGPFTRKDDEDTWLTAAPPTVPHHRPSLLIAKQNSSSGALDGGVGCRNALVGACALPTCMLSDQASCLTCAGLDQKSLRSGPADRPPRVPKCCGKGVSLTSSVVLGWGAQLAALRRTSQPSVRAPSQQARGFSGPGCRSPTLQTSATASQATDRLSSTPAPSSSRTRAACGQRSTGLASGTTTRRAPRCGPNLHISSV